MALLGMSPRHLATIVAWVVVGSIPLPHVAGTSRTTVSFDFGWRHRLGLHHTPPIGGPPEARSDGPGEDPAEAAVEYNDTSWQPVQLPHDGLIALGASNISCPTGCSGKSFIPRHVMWYRKTFSLPADWSTLTDGEGSSVWVEFDGVFHACVVFLNGVVVARNAEGYLGFRVTLTNATGSLHSAGKPNVLAVFVDPDGGAGFSPLNRSGWWYEGAGIYRHSRLVRTSSLQVTQDGLVARSAIVWQNISTADAGPAIATSANLTVNLTVVNTATVAAIAGSFVNFTLVEVSTGKVVGTATTMGGKFPSLPPGGKATTAAVIELTSPDLWAARSPALYTVKAELCRDGGVMDSVNVSHGFRELTFSGADDTPSCTLNRGELPEPMAHIHAVHHTTITAQLSFHCVQRNSSGEAFATTPTLRYFLCMLPQLSVSLPDASAVLSNRFLMNLFSVPQAPWTCPPNAHTLLPQQSVSLPDAVLLVAVMLQLLSQPVVGGAVPDRIKLFRAQMSRAVGGNARRTSHNPPDPTMLSIYDRLGTVVMDETRIFNALDSSVDAMAALVRRDRNHPAVAMWSFCNEEACEQPGAWSEQPPQLGAPLFAAAVEREDGTRPTTANTPGWEGPYPPYVATDLLTRNIDIQGFSHAGMQQGDSNAHLDGNPSLGKAPNTPAIFHNLSHYKTKPILGSECCSCNTMRDEDVGCESSNGQDVCIQKSFSADCAQEQTEVYDNAPYVVGTMVWTLFDYLGEPSGTWPTVISSFGQFDLAGFPKAQASWYQAKWLLRLDDYRADKTFATGGSSVVHLVESWEKPQPTPPIKWGCNRTAFLKLCAKPQDDCEACVLKHQAEMNAFGCHPNSWNYLCSTGGAAPPSLPPSPPGTKLVTVYSAAASVELLVNGVSLGTRQLPVQHHTAKAKVVQTWAQWENVSWATGNATAVGRNTAGKVVAVDTRYTSGVAAAVVLSLDAPSVLTGTGTALLADGQDTALVRATVVDSAGHTVHDASNVIAFAVASGDGRLTGTHNGRVDSHARSDSSEVAAYHGLARGVILVTSAAALTASERALLTQIDLHTQLVGLDGMLASVEIVVEASSPGLPTARLSIPVSTSSEHGVLAVAAATAGKTVRFR